MEGWGYLCWLKDSPVVRCVGGTSEDVSKRGRAGPFFLFCGPDTRIFCNNHAPPGHDYRMNNRCYVRRSLIDLLMRALKSNVRAIASYGKKD